MTVDEIFKALNSHALVGIMFHDDQCKYYDFLKYQGFKRLSEYRFYDEMKGFHELNKHFMDSHNKLIQSEKVTPKTVIPASWFNHKRFDVDTNTKRNAVKEGINAWAMWERDTKELYQQMYKELVEIGEIDDALFISKMIEDVSEELKCAERMHLKLEGCNYDLVYIEEIQPDLHDRYKKKMKNVLD